MSWSIPEPLPAVKDHPLPFRAQIGRESDGRPPTSSSIERFTGGRVRYQCHGVFLSRYRQLRTIPYHFELRSAEKATDAPHLQPLSHGLREGVIDTHHMNNALEPAKSEERDPPP